MSLDNSELDFDIVHHWKDPSNDETYCGYFEGKNDGHGYALNKAIFLECSNRCNKCFNALMQSKELVVKNVFR